VRKILRLNFERLLRKEQTTKKDIFATSCTLLLSFFYDSLYDNNNGL